MKITETKVFNLTPRLKNAVRVTFLNRRGGTDCVSFTRFYNTEVKTKGQTFNAGISERTYAVEADRTNTYHSQHLSEAEFNWLQDLMLSPVVSVNGQQVRVLDSSYKFDSIDRLWTIELQVQSIFSENKITL
ncbi:hypothetical protein EFA69_06615 [Rufibacter immobilis]|uniref:Uncharacterized protein n=1 Tax=Rufibacter immobilis TaxID=1348778 RepID=A0A3M9MZI4_9BACT|nr:hypothetical protein [Rufibacter immobilis]RNI30959.1 hypothetical protein EFA69_06615 [Rufibacter immobilis]